MRKRKSVLKSQNQQYILSGTECGDTFASNCTGFGTSQMNAISQNRRSLKDLDFFSKG